MEHLHGKVAVITGGANGLGREFALKAASAGMKLVLGDVENAALEQTIAQLRAQGVDAIGVRCDVRNAADVQRLADQAMASYGAVHLLFNNAGVGCGGLIWEHSANDWDWVLGVNLMGVVHGVRIFVPLMLACAQRDPAYQGHVVNTASMAGLINAPTMGIYSVSKHAVVSLTESLYHDLQLTDAPIGASVLCPYFVPTGIHQSQRNRPDDVPSSEPTASQRVAQAMTVKAVESGKVSAADVAGRTFDAIRSGQFYIYSHPEALGNVAARMEDIVQTRNPSDPYAATPHVRQALRTKLGIT